MERTSKFTHAARRPWEPRSSLLYDTTEQAEQRARLAKRVSNGDR